MKVYLFFLFSFCLSSLLPSFLSFYYSRGFIKAWQVHKWLCPVWWTSPVPCWRSKRVTCWQKGSVRPWATTWRSTGTDTLVWSSWSWHCSSYSTHMQRWAREKKQRSNEHQYFLSRNLYTLFAVTASPKLGFSEPSWAVCRGLLVFQHFVFHSAPSLERLEHSPFPLCFSIKPSQKVGFEQ